MIGLLVFAISYVCSLENKKWVLISFMSIIVILFGISTYNVYLENYDNSNKKLEDEINKSKKYVYNLTGYTPILVRPPYGNINNSIRKFGYGPYILWNNDTLDWKLRDAKKIYNRLTNSIEENNIILMHDTYLTTYKALELILPYLKENNYKVVTVSKLFAINGKTLESTKSYRYAN